MHIFCSGGAAPQAGAFYRAAFPFFIFLAQAAAVAVAGTSKLLTTVSSTMLLILAFFCSMDSVGELFWSVCRFRTCTILPDCLSCCCVLLQSCI
jgi:hypothetical protein